MAPAVYWCPASYRDGRVQQFGVILVGILIATLSACGGGGSPAPPTPPAPPMPAPNSAPTASFTISTTTGVVPLAVSFDAAASSDVDGTIAAFDWDFGDGATASGSTISHSYTVSGTYLATLTVTDNIGATDTASRTITANPANTPPFTLSGALQILPSSAVDSDVNDVLSVPNQSNNSFANAQPLPLPVILGGFVNLPNTGPASGRLFSSGDSADFYRLSLAGGETALLAVAEADADLDLRLWDADQMLIDASVGATPTESVMAEIAGDYFLEIVPVTGASAYVLTVGQSITASADVQVRGPTRLSDPFVVNELLLEPQIGFTPNNHRLTRTAQAGRVELHKIAPLGYRAASTNSGTMTSEQAQRYATLDAIRKLSTDPSVRCVEPNLLRQTFLTPDDTLLGSQWHYNSISLPLAWDLTTGDPGVIVAVIDTGLLLSHPDFVGQLVQGYDFVSALSNAGDGNGIDSSPDDPGDNAIVGSSSFHGTHVSGTVAASTNNGTGVAGVAWSTRLMPLRALGLEGGSSFDIMQALRFAAGLDNNSGTLPSQAADVINMSLGGSFFSQNEQNLLDEIRNLGIIVVAAAGNESTSTPSYPAGYNGVLSVSATTISNTLATYSNRGSSIDLAAPGGNSGTDQNGDGLGDGVLSTLGDDSSGAILFGFGVLNGTSMASPHVAGVIALMKAVHPGLTPAQLDAALLAGDLTNDAGEPGRDDLFGHGIINAQKAVLTALALANGGSSDPGPILSGSTSALNFGGFQTEFEITLQNVGTGELEITGIVSGEPWLSATPRNVDSTGAGSYSISVDRSGLADGSYSSEVSFTTATNNFNLTVVMQVASIDLSANAGTHFIILLDTSGNTVSQTFVQEPTVGFYNYTLTDVQPGDYQLFAGSDLDNDDFLCDGGEACGAFRTLDAPETFRVDADRNDLNFISGFRQTISAGTATAQSAPVTDKIAETGFAIDKSKLEESP